MFVTTGQNRPSWCTSLAIAASQRDGAEAGLGGGKNSAWGGEGLVRVFMGLRIRP